MKPITATINASHTLPPITTIRTTYYRPERRSDVRWIVLHATHGAEGLGRAAATCRTLRERRVSAHYVLDTQAVIQCVPEDAEAWHAGRNANMRGIGIELCGSASQTREQWLDAQSLPMLENAARLIADICRRHTLPAALLTAPDLLAGRYGITTHAHVTAAFPSDTTHWDPGLGFPLREVIAAALHALERSDAP